MRRAERVAVTHGRRGVQHDERAALALDGADDALERNVASGALDRRAC